MDTVNSQLQEASDAISAEEFEKALGILWPLAEANVAGALGLLGLMFQIGAGVEVNGPRAVELLKKAMDLGDGVSAHNLGTIYAMGLPGVDRDPVLSKWHYHKAKEMGAQFAPDYFYD